MRRTSALIRASFLWAIPVLVAILLWAPITHFASSGIVQATLAVVFVGVVGGSLVRAAAAMSGELWSGRYDETHVGAREVRSPSTIPRRGRWLDAALFAVSLILTIGVLELVFRVFLPQPLYAAQYTSWGWWHIPNTCVVHGADPKTEGKLLRGTEFVTRLCYNSVGMRDVERSVAKPAGTKRILVLGDSYGEEIEVDFEQTVPRILERMLNSDLSALPTSRVRATTNTAAGPRDDILDPTTRAIWRTLGKEALEIGAGVLAAGVHFQGGELERRVQFVSALGISFVDISDRDYDRYHFHFDGHWNPAGTQRAAELIYREIVSDGLLVRDGDLRQVEVLNASMTAFSTCKELRVFQEIGKRFSPDLIVMIWTASDSRNDADHDICVLEPDGTLRIRERTYSPVQHAVRAARSWVKTNSHFLTWVSDRLDTLPAIAELRRTFLQGQDDVRFIEGPQPRTSP